MKRVTEYFNLQGWKPNSHQKQLWKAWVKGEQGLLSTPTGSGKTFAAVGAAFQKFSENPPEGLELLYVTPLKALAEDIYRSIQPLLQHCNSKATIGIRTGDSTSYQKKKIRDNMPNVLITTPESLALLVSYGSIEDRFSNLKTVVVDEWHDLLPSKRGVLLSLNLQTLRRNQGKIKVWGLSATINDPENAARFLTSDDNAVVIKGKNLGVVEFETLVPKELSRLGWSGHLGLRGLGALSERLDWNVSNILFTNTRNQAEIWFRALCDLFPDKVNHLGLHHSSIGQDERTLCEKGLKDGSLKVVVSTSSLELGVDFSFVDVIYQIGSPKSVARSLQRAGRSGHQPGRKSLLKIVPTNALELFEIRAIERAVANGSVEPIYPIQNPLDVLIQHLSNRALTQGYTFDEIYQEVKGSLFFKDLKPKELEWALNFLCTGGECLKAYEQHRKMVFDTGRYRVIDKQNQQLQRMNMGTIVSDLSINVKFVRGESLGRVEERYIGRLNPGDVFYLGGRALKLVKFYQDDAIVKPAPAKGSNFPRWVGGRMANTSVLSRYLRKTFVEPNTRKTDVDKIMRRLVQAQEKYSLIPNDRQFLIEVWPQKKGTHIFAYPIQGRHINHSIGLIMAYRLSQLLKATYSIVVSEYGFEILINETVDLEKYLISKILSSQDWDQDLQAAINMSELSKLHFREIARVSNLIWENYPRTRKRSSQIKASASLIHGVFSQFEPENPLLKQAQMEVLNRELDFESTGSVLNDIVKLEWIVKKIPNPSPLGINLIGERLAAKLSTETLEQRILKLVNHYNEE